VEALGLNGAAFCRIVEAMHGEPNFVLLESSMPGGPRSRYSFASWAPFALVRASRDRVAYEHRGRATEVGAAKVLDVVERVANSYRLERPRAGLPPLLGGAIGYLGYEVGADFERVPQDAPDVTGAPRAVFGFYHFVVAHDRETDRVTLSYFEPPDAMPVPSFDDVMRTVAIAAAPRAIERPAFVPCGVAPRTDFTKAEYTATIRRIQEYIRAGDVYQVNLTQRFSVPMNGRSGWGVYRRLAQVNPAPFSAYLSFEGVEVLSSSPERFLHVEGRRVETRPIKGTAPRGATVDLDRASAEWLLASSKNRAELAMIIDLMRSDLGRVCETGSITVDRFPELESYASVHQLVATVRARLRRDRSIYDLLRAAFPGGSITGAPKIRAMQIIDELERARRGVYTGSIGYLGFDGTADLNIAIRTIVVANGMAHAHGGGGIVIDSDDETEYEESLLKVRNLLRALGVEREEQGARATARAT
jgi:para-aminobenzoate synthetase component 1